MRATDPVFLSSVLETADSISGQLLRHVSDLAHALMRACTAEGRQGDCAEARSYGERAALEALASLGCLRDTLADFGEALLEERLAGGPPPREG
jgi:hypothetical protein